MQKSRPVCWGLGRKEAATRLAACWRGRRAQRGLASTRFAQVVLAARAPCARTQTPHSGTLSSTGGQILPRSGRERETRQSKTKHFVFLEREMMGR